MAKKKVARLTMEQRRHIELFFAFLDAVGPEKVGQFLLKRHGVYLEVNGVLYPKKGRKK